MAINLPERAMEVVSQAAQVDEKAQADFILELKRQLLAARKDAEIPEPRPTWNIRFYRFLKWICRCKSFQSFEPLFHLFLPAPEPVSTQPGQILAPNVVEQ